MYASIWEFAGDPADLLPRYEAMVAELPSESLTLHMCLRGSKGIVLVDTCPSQEVFEAFARGDEFAELRRRHGLPDPDRLDGFPVEVAFVGGRRVE
jgi:hypothetical protein